MADWDVAAYHAFADLRLRPAADLAARIGALPEGAICDLGCGSGAAAPLLRSAWPGRHLTGVDTSPAMLEAAQGAGYDALIRADAGQWAPNKPTALIFSNALFHWLPDHIAQFRRLAAFLPPGGVLAVQMPGQHDAPSHALIRELSAPLFPDLFDYADWQPPVATPADYARALAGQGSLDAWETTYLQTMPPDPEGAAHPVRQFTQSTIMRPVLDRLNPAQTARFLAAYDAALAQAYPAEPDGSVLFPFRRVFLVLRRPGG